MVSFMNRDKIHDESSIESLKRFKRHPSRCSNCSRIAYARSDPHRGQQVCEHCGFVISPETTLASGLSPVDQKKTKMPPVLTVAIDDEEYQFLSNREKHRRIEYLQQKYEPYTGNSTTEYRYEGYRAYSQIVKSHYMMTDRQVSYVQEVLDYLKDNGGLRRLHTRCTSEQIILAISLFSMWRDWRVVEVDKDELCDEVGLKPRQYLTIVTNLLQLSPEVDEFNQQHMGET